MLVVTRDRGIMLTWLMNIDMWVGASLASICMFGFIWEKGRYSR